METYIYKVKYKNDGWSNLGRWSTWSIGEIGDHVLVDILAKKKHDSHKRNLPLERDWATAWFNIYSLPEAEFIAKHMLFMDLTKNEILLLIL